MWSGAPDRPEPAAETPAQTAPDWTAWTPGGTNSTEPEPSERPDLDWTPAFPPPGEQPKAVRPPTWTDDVEVEPAAPRVAFPAPGASPAAPPPNVAEPPAAPGAPRRSPRRRGLPVVAALTAALLLGVAAIAALNGGDDEGERQAAVPSPAPTATPEPTPTPTASAEPTANPTATPQVGGVRRRPGFLPLVLIEAPSRGARIGGTISGRAGSVHGVVRVELLVGQRLGGGRCRFYSGARFVTRSCLKPIYVVAAGSDRWRLDLLELPRRGEVVLRAAAIDAQGQRSTEERRLSRR